MDSKSTHIARGHPLCIRLSGSQAPQRPCQDPQPTLRQQSPLRSWGTSPNSSPQARLTMPTPDTSLTLVATSGEPLKSPHLASHSCQPSGPGQRRSQAFSIQSPCWPGPQPGDHAHEMPGLFTPLGKSVGGQGSGTKESRQI